MRKKLLLMGLVMSVVAMAAPVTLEQAQQRAQQFMARRGTAHNMRLAKQQLRIEQAQQDNAYYYVFNVGEQQGFVIVSGDDRTPDILGYADSGSFSDQDMPDNMRAWLQGYEDQMKWMEERLNLQMASKRSVPKQSISTLLTTTWNQDDPYNRLCPVFLNGNRSVTGCVATAMAQVLYYHASKTGMPKGTTKEIAAYDCERNWGSHVHVDAKPVTTFDWGNMLTSYIGKTSDEYSVECNAVATLMAWCGASINMDYADENNGGSSSNLSNVARALPKYYDFEGIYVDRLNYTIQQWTDLMYSELIAGRPVLYEGQSSKSGHAFVIDGYDGDGLFHVNWGWGGDSNGYFALSVLNPYNNEGIGASSSKDGYSFGQNAIIGVQPQQGTIMPDPVLSCISLTATETIVQLYTSGFQLYLDFGFANYSGIDGFFDVGIGLFDEEDNLIKEDVFYSNRSTNFNAYFTGRATRFMEGSFSEGTYYIKSIYRIAGTDNWLKAKDADKYAITATISSSQVTMTNAVLPTIELSGTTITTDDTPRKETLMTLNTNITNNGVEFFNNYIYLFVDNVLAGGKILEVESGSTVAFNIEYTPASSGVKSLRLCTDKQGQQTIATGSIDVKEAMEGETSDNVTLDFSYTIVNGTSDHKVLGNKMDYIITIVNNTDINYSGQYLPMQVIWPEGSATGYPQSLIVPAHSSKQISGTFSDLTFGTTYSLLVRYVKNGAWANGISGNTSNDMYTCVVAFASYDAYGNATLTEATDNYTTPENAVALDMTGYAVNIITPNANPNCLYILDANTQIPDGLDGKNVVKGNVAETITLTDDNGFFTPVTFTARNISYSRKAKLGFVSGSGWETITLPFDVIELTADDETIDWFRSSTDKSKNFWVMAFSGDDGSTVSFDYASEMVAYTPYIFTVPGEDYGDKWNLVGKTLKFNGSNAKIQESNDVNSTQAGSSYKFVGTASAKSDLTNIYKLNDKGSMFETADGVVESFRAYFANTTNQTYAGSLSIGIGGGTTTGIAEMLPTQQMSVKSGIYHLNGMKVGGNLENLPAGIYIINGKKIVK